MIGAPSESASPLRLTGLGLGLAATLFLAFFSYCKIHGLWEEPVPVSESIRWAASGTLCWSTLLLVGWTNREPLRRLATGPAGGQIRLFAGAMAALLVADGISMLLLDLMAGDASVSGVFRQAYQFAPSAAMLSAITMLSLILWNRRVVAQRAAAPAESSEWLSLPEAPLLRLRTEDVRMIRAAGNYSEIVCAERTWLVRATLSDLARRFAANNFVRVHRGAIVNARHVRHISRDPAGRPQVALSGGETVAVGRSYRAALDRLARD